ncbi:scopoletin glucosyltransferase-like isoform X2 [Mercurialis annua]|uniref:scopoletin glucosyltransferase-like isoform X2 n=1 Tax=Mercurialis annua TaxID=3986 RepID=UPI00215E9F92|nr:scopoletin glucosyltransferase-like isoform X2 [Mercurialis annua]
MDHLHVAFFPYMAHGHIIPTMNMAKLFARHGVKSTIITTPFNASTISESIETETNLGFNIGIQLMNFPSAEAELPEGCEIASSINSQEMAIKFAKAMSLLQQPLARILNEIRPDCLVADMMFPWATEVALEFGIPSMFKFSDSQLLELAMAIEACGQNFIWVVNKKEENNEELVPAAAADSEIFNYNVSSWLPEGFEKRTKEKGLIIRRWASQVTILAHQAIGVFMTHCGWNSTLEGVCAGVPMVTWPLHAEQFFNEKLVTDVLRIGIGVGSQEWSRYEKKIIINKNDIEKAVCKLMIGEEGEEMRNRAKKLKEMARNAVEEGGSSKNDLIGLLKELKSIKKAN